MSGTAMNCYRVTIDRTVDRVYGLYWYGPDGKVRMESEDHVVYVLARSVAELAAFVGDSMVAFERVGPGYWAGATAVVRTGEKSS